MYLMSGEAEKIGEYLFHEFKKKQKTMTKQFISLFIWFIFLLHQNKSIVILKQEANNYKWR